MMETGAPFYRGGACLLFVYTPPGGNCAAPAGAGFIVARNPGFPVVTRG
jgi:hypothetical protein